MPPVTTKDKIRELLKNKTLTEKIAILESLSKEFRQRNCIRINKVYSGNGLKVDPDRSDLIELKNETN